MFTITLGGSTYEAQPPATFADREDLVRGWAGEAANTARGSSKLYAATLALCVPALGIVADLDKVGGDLAEAGAAIYEELRGRGFKRAEIREAANACHAEVVKSLYPRAPEVAKTEDFSEAGAPPT